MEIVGEKQMVWCWLLVDCPGLPIPGFSKSYE